MGKGGGGGGGGGGNYVMKQYEATKIVAIEGQMDCTLVRSVFFMEALQNTTV